MFDETFGHFVPSQPRAAAFYGGLTHMQTDAFSILLALDHFGTSGYSERRLADESGVPRRTLRRYLHTPHMEKVSEEQLLHLRGRTLSPYEGTGKWTSALVNSYYSQVLSSRQPFLMEDGSTAWYANTTYFPILVEVGARHDWSVTLSPTTGLPTVERRRVDAYALDHATLEGYL